MVMREEWILLQEMYFWQLRFLSLYHYGLTKPTTTTKTASFLFSWPLFGLEMLYTKANRKSQKVAFSAEMAEKPPERFQFSCINFCLNYQFHGPRPEAISFEFDSALYQLKIPLIVRHWLKKYWAHALVYDYSLLFCNFICAFCVMTRD